MRAVFLISVAVGIGLGLTYAWLIDPVEFTTADPYHVDARYQEAWLVMAAEAYITGDDWDRTQARLDGLKDPNLAQTAAALFERYSANGPNPQARALARLVERLDARAVTAGMLVYLTTPVTPTPRATSFPASIPPTGRPAQPTPTSIDAFPTLTPSATPTPEFVVVSSDGVCESGAPQIRVAVQDAEGNGLPGVDVWITWDGGADRFVTGLKPELGPGFGDFDMQPDVSYRVGAGSQSTLALVGNLSADPCTTDVGAEGRLSWNVVLQPLTP
ncbi:MAG TPA: hypothetical protein VFL17_12115 [Anaerolineae bacterium]|nr:hypothetical protein [Anaerolineae bacterium]